MTISLEATIPSFWIHL